MKTSRYISWKPESAVGILIERSFLRVTRLDHDRLTYPLSLQATITRLGKLDTLNNLVAEARLMYSNSAKIVVMPSVE